MSRISVFVRLRPPNQNERKTGMKMTRIDPDSELREIRVFNENNDRAKVFKFNKVFTENYSQEEVFYEAEANKLVEKVLEGYHSTIFAYGQTGSGKTYSMEGLNYQLVDNNPRIIGNLDETNKNLGIIPRALRYMFSLIGRDEQRTYQISLSYLQIYNERIYDLLDYDNKDKLANGLKLRWNKYDQFTVENIESVPCRSVQEALSIYLRGARNKNMAKHRMNMNSSRSHTILTVRVQSFDNEDPKNVLSSKLELVDLAGSERQSITGSTGKVFREGIEINKSLFTLRQVISSLFEYNKNIKADSMREPVDFHVPYRDSKLTSILKQSIGGNNYCVMVACLNPGDGYLEESVQTLTYASMASYISNIPVRNEDPKMQEIKMLREQLAEVTEQLHRANQHIKLLSELANKRIQSGGSKIEPARTLQHNPPEAPYQTKPHRTESNRQPQSDVELQKPKPPSQQIAARSQSLKPKEFIESINMIKDLLQSNIILRENIQKLNRAVDKKDSELYQVIKQNQVLRDRWEVIGPMLAAEQQNQKKETLDDNKNISAYERMLEDKNGQLRPMSLRHAKYYTASGSNVKYRTTNANESGTIESKQSGLNMSYNQLLRQHPTRRQSNKKKNRVSYL